MYHKIVLENGLKIVVEEIHQIRSVSLGIFVKVGSGNEKPDFNGLSHFIEHMMFKGTQKRGMAEIAQEMDTLGGQIGASTGREFTCYYGKVLDEHLDQIVDILSDIFCNSVFDIKEIEREKKVILEEIKMYEDTPDELIHDNFIQDIWSNHPLGQSILGSKEIITNLQREKIIDFWQHHYIPEETVISVAGNVSVTEVVRLIENSFCKEFKATISKFDSKAPIITPKMTSYQRDLEQVHMCLGTLGISVTDDDRFVLRILNTILGSGMSSRLFQEIREKRALAYDVHSYINSYQKAGLFVVSVGTSPEHYQEAVNIILKEFSRLKEEYVHEDELKRTKEKIKVMLVLAFEDSTYRMSKLAEQELNFGRFFSIDEILELIDRVSVADIQRVAQKLFLSEYLTLSCLGPLTQEEIEKIVLKC